jgi:hypothetical protein
VTRIINHYIDFHKRCVIFENIDLEPGASVMTATSTGMLLEEDFEVDQFEQAFVNGVNRAVKNDKDAGCPVLQDVTRCSLRAGQAGQASSQVPQVPRL